MKYKIGDRVVIQSQSYIKKMAHGHYNNYCDFKFNTFTYSMLQYCNKVMTINDIWWGKSRRDKDKLKYKFKEDNGRYSWYEDWFYPYTQAGKILFGDTNEM